MNCFFDHKQVSQGSHYKIKLEKLSPIKINIKQVNETKEIINQRASIMIQSIYDEITQIFKKILEQTAKSSFKVQGHDLEKFGNVIKKFISLSINDQIINPPETEEIEDYLADINRKNAELVKINKVKKNFLKKIEELKKKNSEMEKKIKEKDDLLDEKNQDFEKLNTPRIFKKGDEMIHKNNELTQTINELTQKNNELTQINNELTQIINEMKSDFLNSKKILNNVYVQKEQELHKKLTEKNQKMNKKVEQAEDRIKKIIKEKDELLNEKEEKYSKIFQEKTLISEELDHSVSTQNRLKEEIDSLRSQIKSLENQKKDLNIQKKELNDQLNKNILNHEYQINELNQVIRKLQSSNSPFIQSPKNTVKPSFILNPSFFKNLSPSDYSRVTQIFNQYKINVGLKVSNIANAFVTNDEKFVFYCKL